MHGRESPSSGQIRSREGLLKPYCMRRVARWPAARKRSADGKWFGMVGVERVKKVGELGERGWAEFLPLETDLRKRAGVGAEAMGS